MQEEAIRPYRTIGQLGWRKTSSMLSIWSIDKWISVLARGGGPQERVRYCLNPNNPYSSCTFDHARTFRKYYDSCIARQCTVTRNLQSIFVHHVGIGKAFRSTVNHGLIPGGLSKQEDKLCSSLVWIRWIIKITLEKPHTICHKQESHHSKIIWKCFQNAVFWCNLKLAQEKRLQFFEKKKINAVVLYDTLHAEFTEKATCMKTKDQFCQKGKRDSKTACCSWSLFAM